MENEYISDYHLQSQQQQTLLKTLSDYAQICITPLNSPFQLELMGKLSLKTDQRGTRLVIGTKDVKQVLSVNWRSVHFMRLNPSQDMIIFYNSVRDILAIRCIGGPFSKCINMPGLLQTIPHPPTKTTTLRLNFENWHLSPVRSTDRNAYLHYLNDPLIYRYTMNIPYPYTEKDADQWLSMLDLQQWESGAVFNMAIRNNLGELCGGIGISNQVHKTHKGEIGYWLAQPYWGKGIMTATLMTFCQWAFQTFNLQRITAQIMDINKASESVLLKSGFKLEGLMTRYFVKDRQTHDGKLYALTGFPDNIS